ncbi:MAG: Hsp20/alpha crystallin family protein [Candidatus Iainarchaeum archaeon]|uniref:Hsp20/alpha crystallin family protein n=1 Tax=Candidatus Iainarchaeum sp. TaxID=3101447 RepID=A0A497JHP9_9ARCH|nr:MAG: Hsp20/alpha crystallin family protein [Candidatus Diapherotrites archaeon]
MRKKKRRIDFFFDFDRLEELMDELMREFLEEPTFKEKKIFRKKPLVMGFSFRFDEKGNPIVEGFGNIKPVSPKKVEFSVREPLTAINKTKKEIIITAELPGVEEKDIKIKVEPHKVIIDVPNPENPFYKEITLKEKVDTKKFKKIFKNGILELTLKKK